MALRYLLDTNICIYIRDGRRTEVLARFTNVGSDQTALSVITFGELMFGAENSRERDRAIAGVEEIAGLMRILPLPLEAAEWYGKCRATLSRAGRIIGNNDLWIAAHALAAGLTLVTNNKREFDRIAGLTVENWAD